MVGEWRGEGGGSNAFASACFHLAGRKREKEKEKKKERQIDR